jgi:hypothetical protein
MVLPTSPSTSSRYISADNNLLTVVLEDDGIPSTRLSAAPNLSCNLEECKVGGIGHSSGQEPRGRGRVSPQWGQECLDAQESH